MRVIFIKLLFAILLIGAPMSQAAGKVVIGTGGETGVYYATGQVLCKLLEAKGVDCVAPSSGGSVANLKVMKMGEVTFAMAQSDWQFHAYHGSTEWTGEQMDKLRAVFSVYAEPVQVVVNRDAKIRNWYALKGHSINIGNVGAGHRQTMEEMLDAQHWKLETFSAVHELPSSEQVDAFCAGKFEAFVYAVGIPNAAMKRAVSECNGNLIEPHNTIIRKLATAARPYYSKVKIPAKTYWDGQKKVDTFGVMATLVTMSDTDATLVDALVKAVFEDFDTFRGLHPAYANSTPEMMVKDGLSAPLHPAAEAYYKSRGWLK
ncbi:MAG: TAXI family TRAP transporter solute-binding subunit [Rhodospirillales bacterium]|nr:TAXI family TRAP transporter solute-binding subunit [Rhodospirillales bacterium]MBO6785661.1 TAXI family TRAP transporter solute-binding subunit [Rhodospirillales bacterium]